MVTPGCMRVKQRKVESLERFTLLDMGTCGHKCKGKSKKRFITENLNRKWPEHYGLYYSYFTSYVKESNTSIEHLRGYMYDRVRMYGVLYVQTKSYLLVYPFTVDGGCKCTVYISNIEL